MVWLLWCMMLQDVRERSEWDCETVLPTCSNTDNLPTVIGEPLSKAGRRRRQAEEEGKEEGGAGALGWVCGRASPVLGDGRLPACPSGIAPMW